MTNEIYKTKTECYFSNARIDLLNLIPKEKKMGSLLEIGAGSGDTLLYAKNNRFADKIYGVELCEIENSNQDSNEFEKFIIGNIEEIELDFDEDSFDAVICGDVLEHLINPYETVSKLKKYMKKDAIFIASIPNIRYWRVLKEIIFEGDFKYVEAGILDKTHLRFFCKKNMKKLFLDNGFDIINVVSNVYLNGGKTEIFNKITLKKIEEFLATQYHIVSKKI